MRLLLLFLLFIPREGFAQSADFISVRKKNGRTLKNIYAGTPVKVQLYDGSYREGPVQAVRNDSVFLNYFIVQRYVTNWNTVLTDTVRTATIAFPYRVIKRVYLNKRRPFLQRMVGPVLLSGGGGYLLLNTVNGALLNEPISDPGNKRRLARAGVASGLGAALILLLKTDGFSRRHHRIVYVSL